MDLRYLGCGQRIEIKFWMVKSYRLMPPAATSGKCFNVNDPVIRFVLVSISRIGEEYFKGVGGPKKQ